MMLADAGGGGALLLLLALYFIPAIVASSRNHHQQTAIFILNLLLGWTVLGWICALVWACTAVYKPAPAPAPVKKAPSKPFFPVAPTKPVHDNSVLYIVLGIAAVVFGGVALGFIIPIQQQPTTTTTMPQSTVLEGLTPEQLNKLKATRDATPVNDTGSVQARPTVPTSPPLPRGTAKGSRDPSITGSNSKQATAAAIVTGPAPSGEPTEVARKVIADNFDFRDCPAVIQAVRMLDGSIAAVCSNDETFRVFSIPSAGRDFAMRCSAVNKLNIPGLHC